MAHKPTWQFSWPASSRATSSSVWNLSHGGHLSHGSPVNFSGLHFVPVSYTVHAETGRVNYEELEQKAREERPKLIIAGGSAYSREWDYARIRKVADEIGAIFMVDMAHPAGLIAADLLENPLKHAHIVTTTTHKTLRGTSRRPHPHGQRFRQSLGKEDSQREIRKMSALLDSAVFPGVQGDPLEHVIAAKAVAFGEALQPEWKEYAIRIKKNADALAAALMKLGYKIISDGTDNHCMLVDLRPKFPEMSGKKAERVLVEADITANKNMVPYDSRSPFLTSGLRFRNGRYHYPWSERRSDGNHRQALSTACYAMPTMQKRLQRCASKSMIL